MNVLLHRVVLAEYLSRDTLNILPERTTVEVLDDGPEQTQVVAVSFEDDDMEWLIDGRVLAIDWAVFEQARTTGQCEVCGIDVPAWTDSDCGNHK